MIFSTRSPQAPCSQRSLPWGCPFGHHLFISVFPPLVSVYAMGSSNAWRNWIYWLMSPFFYQRLQWPILAIFSHFCQDFGVIWHIPRAFCNWFMSYPTPYHHQTATIDNWDSWGQFGKPKWWEHLLFGWPDLLFLSEFQSCAFYLIKKTLVNTF